MIQKFCYRISDETKATALLLGEPVIDVGIIASFMDFQSLYLFMESFVKKDKHTLNRDIHSITVKINEEILNQLESWKISDASHNKYKARIRRLVTEIQKHLSEGTPVYYEATWKTDPWL